MLTNEKSIPERPINITPTGKSVPKEVREDIALLCIYSILNKIKKEESS
ncbi:MAG: hypothetical protein ACI4J6_04985 [Oscillospiraceae bacterium]